jgi:hypothetical protein
MASENGDKETVIDAYLDCIDYSKLDESVFERVAEAMSYEECTDHVLFGHLKDEMDARNLDCRVYAAVYYINVNGGLTAADLLNALA